MNINEIQLSLGTPLRKDGLPRNWILNDDEYLSAPSNVVKALADYEKLRNRVIKSRTENALREAYRKLRQPALYTWEEWRASRETAYALREQYRLPLLLRQAIAFTGNRELRLARPVTGEQ